MRGTAFDKFYLRIVPIHMILGQMQIILDNLYCLCNIASLNTHFLWCWKSINAHTGNNFVRRSWLWARFDFYPKAISFCSLFWTANSYMWRSNHTFLFSFSSVANHHALSVNPPMRHHQIPGNSIWILSTGLRLGLTCFAMKFVLYRYDCSQIIFAAHQLYHKFKQFSFLHSYLAFLY